MLCFAVSVHPHVWGRAAAHAGQEAGSVAAVTESSRQHQVHCQLPGGHVVAVGRDRLVLGKGAFLATPPGLQTDFTDPLFPYFLFLCELEGGVSGSAVEGEAVGRAELCAWC